MANKCCRCGVKCSIAPVNYLHDIFNTRIKDCESDGEILKNLVGNKKVEKSGIWENF